jgi:16S rRNA (cytidine1402-2'-O)-methyltransferase
VSGRLSVIGTPIGNLEDLSPRAARTLAAADIIACEDTRVARKLIARTLPGGARARLVPYHAHTQRGRTEELVHAVAAGAHVALTTDAGMPGLSDPGRHLVAACAAAGLPIEIVPGPSAVLAALVASGLPTGRFTFEGFLPRTSTARRRRLRALAGEERTLVLFEAPHRLEACLEEMAEAFGARPAAIARELTKIHEEVVRGTIPELLAAVRAAPPRGEITLVVEGAPEARPAAGVPDPAALARAVRARTRAGASRKDAIAAVAAERGVSKKLVYGAVLESKQT